MNIGRDQTAGQTRSRWVGFTTIELEELGRWAETAWFAGPDDPSLLDDLRAELVCPRAANPG